MNTPVLFSVGNHTAIITLNRPERRNAINQALLIGLYDALDAVGQKDEIRVAVITGAGRKGLPSGDR